MNVVTPYFASKIEQDKEGKINSWILHIGSSIISLIEGSDQINVFSNSALVLSNPLEIQIQEELDSILSTFEYLFKYSHILINSNPYFRSLEQHIIPQVIYSNEFYHFISSSTLLELQKLLTNFDSIILPAAFSKYLKINREFQKLQNQIRNILINSHFPINTSVYSAQILKLHKKKQSLENDLIEITNQFNLIDLSQLPILLYNETLKKIYYHLIHEKLNLREESFDEHFIEINKILDTYHPFINSININLNPRVFSSNFVSNMDLIPSLNLDLIQS